MAPAMKTLHKIVIDACIDINWNYKNEDWKGTFEIILVAPSGQGERMKLGRRTDKMSVWLLLISMKMK